MNCPKCKTPMIIDEWDGWIWRCFNCDHKDRKATFNEIEEQEKEYCTRLAQISKDNAEWMERNNNKGECHVEKS